MADVFEALGSSPDKGLFLDAAEIAEKTFEKAGRDLALKGYVEIQKMFQSYKATHGSLSGEPELGGRDVV